MAFVSGPDRGSKAHAAESLMQSSVSTLRNALLAVALLTLMTGCLEDRQYDPPTVSVSVSPTRAAVGTPITVTWSSQYAQSCTASGGWSGSKDASGSQSVTLTSANTFTLACTGRGGQASASATVEPLPPPTVTFTGSTSKVLPGEAVALTWSSTNATACTASGSWSGTKGTSGTETPAAPTDDATYTLTCTGPGGSRAASVSAQYIGFVASKLVGTRLYINGEPVSGYPPGYGGNGLILELNSNGQGVLLASYTTPTAGRYNQPTKDAFTWSVSNGKLITTYSAPISSTGFRFVGDLRFDTDELAKLNASGFSASSQVPSTSTTTGYSYTKLKDGRYAASATSTATRVTAVPPIRLNDGSFLTPRNYPVTDTGSSTIILRAPNDLTALKFTATCPGASGTICLAGTTWAGMNHTDSGLDDTTGALSPEAFVADGLTFNADGTGRFETDDTSNPGFRWTVNADGTLTIRGQDGSGTFRLADVADGGIFNGAFVELTLDSEVRGATYAGLVKKDDSFRFDTAYATTASGKYWRAEINNWSNTSRDASGTLTSLSVFGWKFASNGSGSTISGESADCNNDGTANEIRGVLSPFEWSIQNGTGFEAGYISILRNIGSTASPLIVNRDWYPVARGTAADGTRFFYAIEYEEVVRRGSITYPDPRTRIATRLNKFVEVADGWSCTR